MSHSMAPRAHRRAALGFSPHIGWAAIAVVSGPPEEPTLVAKRRVEMARTFETGAVYHASQRLPVAEAERLVRSSEQTFEAAAEATIAALAEELRRLGVEPTASVILAGRAKPLPPLETILIPCARSRGRGRALPARSRARERGVHHSGDVRSGSGARRAGRQGRRDLGEPGQLVSRGDGKGLG
jgi:hypothetical protein